MLAAIMCSMMKTMSMTTLLVDCAGMAGNCQAALASVCGGVGGGGGEWHF